MPICSLAFTLLRTSISEAALLPARMTASPGRRPAPARFAAYPATCVRICAAILLPSRTVAMVVVIGIEQFNHKGLKGTQRQVTLQDFETILDVSPMRFMV